MNSKLKWKAHIESVVGPAKQKLFLVMRSLKFANPGTKIMAYKLFIRSMFQDANTIWYPHTSEGMMKIEEVQKVAARFIFNKYVNRISASGLV